MPISSNKIDYHTPDYTPIMQGRLAAAQKLSGDKKLVAALRLHYRHAPWEFVNDWGMTFEPRNVEKGLLSTIPLMLWPKQVEFLQWMHARWQSGERGLCEKSRDCGVTWLAVGYAVSQFLFEDGFTTGFGSRKEELVDKRGDSKSIFEKVRFFLRFVPKPFMPDGWDERTCSAHMRIFNPENSAAIIGESGDEIGRGGRTSMYIVDEAAFVERQEKVDAALSQNTNCQLDVSSVNGNGNLFYKKRQRFDGTDRLFIFDWRDDPRKDDDWYQKQLEEQDEVTVAQEIDRDYNASQEDAFIPAKWVKASIDAHKKLGFRPLGIKRIAFDPADTGDAKALAGRHGSVVVSASQMKRGDITDAIPWVLESVAAAQPDEFIYDADGMGAPIIKLSVRDEFEAKGLPVEPYNGGPMTDEEKEKINLKLDKPNEDAFLNENARLMYELRTRFENVYNAVVHGVYCNPEDMISIDSGIECLHELVAEISRPKRIYTNSGVIRVESKAEMKNRTVESPNLLDCVKMCFKPIKPRRKKKQLEYPKVRRI